MTIHHVAQESSQQVSEIADVLSRAFFDDSFYINLMPKDSKRAAQLHWWTSSLTRYAYKYGSVWATDDLLQGVALWLKPGAPGPNLIDFFRTKLVQAPLQLGWMNFWWLWQTTNKWEKIRHQQAGPYWYLMMVGVDPAYQGQGIGSSLLQPILRQADQMKTACYLETTSAGNLPFYQKFGFDVFNQRQIKPKLSYWMMRREPAIDIS